MMKYYQLNGRVELENGRFAPSLHNSIEMGRMLDYSTSIKYGEFWASPTTIKLNLFSENGKNKPFLDLHEWTVTKPRAYLLVVSDKVKDIICQFRLPEHRWYGCSISRENEVSIAYKVLHVLDQKLSSLDFPEIEFDLLTDPDTVVGQLPKGQIEDLNSFKALTELEISVNDTYPRPREFIYKSDCNYDCAWGIGQLVFNEKVKQAIEAAGFGPHNGLGFKEFTDYQIIMPGEQT
jgi:hypothetical protein